MQLITPKCPISQELLHVMDAGMVDEIRGKIAEPNKRADDQMRFEGLMVNESGTMAYPISGGIPRILKALAISLSHGETGEIR